jgi:hypothetical protein
MVAEKAHRFFLQEFGVAFGMEPRGRIRHLKHHVTYSTVSNMPHSRL